MFQFPAFASVLRTDDGIAPAGLPHSDIRGSMGICPSPRLFAACHVLLRLREPRHPPCALGPFRFTFMEPSLAWFRYFLHPLAGMRLTLVVIYSLCLRLLLCLLAQHPRHLRWAALRFQPCQCPISCWRMHACVGGRASLCSYVVRGIPFSRCVRFRGSPWQS